MREPGVVQKVGNRSGLAAKARSGGIAQRPVRRRGGERFADRLRAVLNYVPLLLKLVLVIAASVLLFLGYRAAVAASFFRLRSVEVQGTVRASSDVVQALVRRELSTTGVWQANLKALSAHVEQLPWVRSAIISRVLPGRIRVRILEREPRAVVRLSSGRFYWVDVDAVLLGEMQPNDRMPTFFVRGWDEDESPAAGATNRERVQRYSQLVREWDAAGLSERVSEVNLIDLGDIRAQLAGDDSQIEVRLGGEELGPRLANALKVLDQERQTPLGRYITYIIMTQKNPIVGHSANARLADDGNRSGQQVESIRSRQAGDNSSSTNIRQATARPGSEPTTSDRQGIATRERRVKVQP